VEYNIVEYNIVEYIIVEYNTCALLYLLTLHLQEVKHPNIKASLFSSLHDHANNCGVPLETL
jgi:hypothetical protein